MEVSSKHDISPIQKSNPNGTREETNRVAVGESSSSRGANKSKSANLPKEGPSYADIVSKDGLDARPEIIRGGKEKGKNESATPKMGESMQSIFNIKWTATIVITRKNFHDDWPKVKATLQELVNDKLMINPFHLDKAMLSCHNETTAKLLCTNKGWVTLGAFTVKFEGWNLQEHGRM